MRTGVVPVFRADLDDREIDTGESAQRFSMHTRFFGNPWIPNLLSEEGLHTGPEVNERQALGPVHPHTSLAHMQIPEYY